MSLKGYNELQCKLFKEYRIIDDIMITNIVEFRKICNMISIVRDYNSIEEAEREARKIIETELKEYNN